MLSELSPPLHRDILHHLYLGFVREVPLFADLDPGFLSAMVASVQPRIYMAGEPVFSRGELSREMYFIAQGTVEALDKAGRRAALLEARARRHY